MLEKYTDILYVESREPLTVLDDGSYSLSGKTWLEHSLCKVVFNGSNQFIKIGNGADYVFSYLVFLPADVKNINIGEQVKATRAESDEIIALGSVKRFLRGRLGCKIWL